MSSSGPMTCGEYTNNCPKKKLLEQHALLHALLTSTISPAGNPLMMLRSVCKVSATWFSVSKSTVFLGDEAHAAFNAWFF